MFITKNDKRQSNTSHIMLDGHRHQIQISFLNQLTDSTSITQIVELAKKAYDTPQKGAKFVTTESAER